MHTKQTREISISESKAGQGHVGAVWGALPLDITRLLGVLIRIELRRQLRLRAVREQGDHSCLGRNDTPTASIS